MSAMRRGDGATLTDIFTADTGADELAAEKTRPVGIVTHREGWVPSFPDGSRVVVARTFHDPDRENADGLPLPPVGTTGVVQCSFLTDVPPGPVTGLRGRVREFVLFLDLEIGRLPADALELLVASVPCNRD